MHSSKSQTNGLQSRDRERGGGTLTEMHTVSGMPVLLSDPSEVCFELEDIAHALSNICRFNGHVEERYTVLSHSLSACELAPAEHKLEALMHDTGEAYMGDIILPVKELFPEIADYEDTITGMIFTKFAPKAQRVDSSTGKYKKSPMMITLDGRLARGESFILRPRVPGVYDTEVARLMEKYWNATPETFLEKYKELTEGE